MLQLYDGTRFSSAGFNMHELFFSDGSCPSENILQTFLQVAETEKGEATHCATQTQAFTTNALGCSFHRATALLRRNKICMGAQVSEARLFVDEAGQVQYREFYMDMQAHWRCTARRDWDGQGC